MIRTRTDDMQSRPSFPLTPNCNFLVEIDGLEEAGPAVAGGFRDVSGLVSCSEILEYRVGNQSAPMKIPGRPVYGNILLSRGSPRRRRSTWGDDVLRRVRRICAAARSCSWMRR